MLEPGQIVELAISITALVCATVLALTVVTFRHQRRLAELDQSGGNPDPNLSEEVKRLRELIVEQSLAIEGLRGTTATPPPLPKTESYVSASAQNTSQQA